MLFRTVFIKLCQIIGNVSYALLMLIALTHYSVAYLLFSTAGETNMTSSHIQFSYYWIVTATTLGYGDVLPTTEIGKLVATSFMIPLSIAIFGMFLTKVGISVATYFKKGVTGMHSFESLTGHTLIIGYHAVRTGEMLALLQAEQLSQSQIVLVSDTLEQHPCQERKDVLFCRVESMKDALSVRRMGVNTAGRFIVDGRGDDENYVLASHYASLNPQAKIVTYITDTHSAERLQAQFGNVMVIIDNREELLIRALMDSGTGTLVNRLLRADAGPTFYMTPMLSGFSSTVCASDIATKLHRHHATFVGYAQDLQGVSLTLNPDPSTVLPGGPVFIHYIASRRFSSDQLNAMLSDGPHHGGVAA